MWKPALGGLAVCLSFSGYCSAQNVQPTAKEMLASAARALGALDVQSVKLSGDVSYIAGSTEEHGTFDATAVIDGSHQLDLTLAGRNRSETHSKSVAGLHSCGWIDNNGTSHSIPEHNCHVDHSWFSPRIFLLNLLGSKQSTFKYIGLEAKDGEQVEHFTVSDSAHPDGTAQDPLVAHIEDIDLYLDSNTQRPAWLCFNLHPDSNAAIDVPVNIEFEDYKQVAGVWTPMHVKKFFNDTLSLDLTVRSVQFQ